MKTKLLIMLLVILIVVVCLCIYFVFHSYMVVPLVDPVPGDYILPTNEMYAINVR